LFSLIRRHDATPTPLIARLFRRLLAASFPFCRLTLCDAAMSPPPLSIIVFFADTSFHRRRYASSPTEFSLMPLMPLSPPDDAAFDIFA
jgi:hypothetical protein